MPDLRSFAIHEVNPLVAESASSLPLSVQEACCTHGTRMRLTGNNAGYVISFPIREPMLALHRGRELDIGPGKAMVFRPLAEVMMMTDDNFDVLVVRIDAAALEDALEARLGYPVRRPLAPTLDLGTAAARGWAASLRHIVDAAVPGGLLGNPMIAEPLQDSLLDGFGPSTTRTGSLDAPVPSWGPRTVRRGVDVIEASPQQPFTMAALAADADVSVRAFEECWSRHRAPAPCLSARVRLARAPLDLEEHAPGETTVAATALRWGFARSAQFATGYARRYGLPPGQTRRGPAYA